MITSLTEEQKAKFPEYVAKWIAVGTCTEPANRAEAEDGVRQAYTLVGKTPPSKIYWFDSPLSGMVGVAAYFYAEKNGIAPKDLKAKHIDEVVKENISNFDCYGQHEAGWLLFYDFFENECNLKEETKIIAGLKKVTMNAGWWWCFEGVAFICERHDVCKLDENNQIHNDTGPAIHWPDGFSIYAVHGVVVPALVIEHPEQITVDMIDKEGNEEVRRIMTERYGVGRYLTDIGAEVIHMDMVKVNQDDPDTLAMPRVLYRDKREQQWLCGTDGSTKRVYYMSVDPQAKTCGEAHASISNGIKDTDIIASS